MNLLVMVLFRIFSFFLVNLSWGIKNYFSGISSMIIMGKLIVVMVCNVVVREYVYLLMRCIWLFICVIVNVVLKFISLIMVNIIILFFCMWCKGFEGDVVCWFCIRYSILVVILEDRRVLEFIYY